MSVSNPGQTFDPGLGYARAAQAQSIEFVSDPWEVKLKGRGSTPHRAAQRAFREGGAWQSSMPNLSGWQVIAQEETMLPSRMWGAGIEFDGDGEDKAMAAWAWALDAFHWSQDVVDGVTWVEGPSTTELARQMLDGRPVLGSMFQAKSHGDRLVLVSSDWWPSLLPWKPIQPRRSESLVGFGHGDRRSK